MSELRFREILPEPRRLWVRFRPANWPGAAGDWIELGGPALGSAGAGPLAELADDRLERLDDLVYLPPVEPGDEVARRVLAERLASAGIPVLLQEIFDPARRAASAGSPAVLDLSSLLFAGRWEELADLPSGSTVIWPWIAGLTDREEVWGPGLEQLAGTGVRSAVAVTPELEPRQRRRLAESAGPEAFADLFHRAPQSLAGFWRAARGLGLEPFPERPLPAAPRSLAVRRRVAGELALAGDLLLHSGDEVAAQSLLRSARRLDAETLDLEALVREGNLGVLAWLDRSAARVVRESLERGRSRLLSDLLAGFLPKPEAEEGEA
jgi:hypothetical protein